MDRKTDQLLERFAELSRSIALSVEFANEKDKKKNNLQLKDLIMETISNTNLSQFPNGTAFDL